MRTQQGECAKGCNYQLVPGEKPRDKHNAQVQPAEERRPEEGAAEGLTI